MGNIFASVDPSFKWARPVNLDLTGKTYVFVGGTDGLGRAMAKLAASKGADVIVVGRTFRDQGHPNIRFVRCDLSSMKDASALASSVPTENLDGLILSAGIIAPSSRQTTAEGIEKDMAISYLSRIGILNAMKDKLGSRRPVNAPLPRVFIFGFPGAGEDCDKDLENLQGEKTYSLKAVHMNTVAGNEALVLYHAKATPKALFFGLNPGLVRTNIRDSVLGQGTLLSSFVEGVIGAVCPSPEQYAAQVLPLLVAPELEGKSGLLFNQSGDAIKPSKCLTPERVDSIYNASEAIVNNVIKTIK